MMLVNFLPLVEMPRKIGAGLDKLLLYPARSQPRNSIEDLLNARI